MCKADSWCSMTIAQNPAVHMDVRTKETFVGERNTPLYIFTTTETYGRICSGAYWASPIVLQISACKVRWLYCQTSAFEKW